MIFGAADDQLYGDGGNDIILVGPGNSLADGGSGDDVLMGGIGHLFVK
jgi:Ca2+-binding RTX toxin-like protein